MSNLSAMIELVYPEPDFNIREEQGFPKIFDRWRKTWLKLTPEEWVRQNFILYLVEVMKYPEVFISIEKQLRLNDLLKRFDVLVYDRDFKPWMMVECKSADIPLSTKVLDQVLRYNMSIPVRYMVITNGRECMCYSRKQGWLEVLPGWSE